MQVTIISDMKAMLREKHQARRKRTGVIEKFLLPRTCELIRAEYDSCHDKAHSYLWGSKPEDTGHGDG